MSPVTVARRLPGFRDCREKRRTKRHGARMTNNPWRRHQKLSVQDRPCIPGISERDPPMRRIWSSPMPSFSVRQIIPSSTSLAHLQPRHGIIPRFRRRSESKRMPSHRRNQMAGHYLVRMPLGLVHLRPVMCSSRPRARWSIRQIIPTWIFLR